MRVGSVRPFLFLAIGPALVSVLMAQTDSETALRQSLTSQFGQLSAAEQRLVAAAANGETADCRTLSAGDKQIRGDLLAWLCANPKAAALCSYRGVRIIGAIVDGEVNLSGLKVPFPIIAVFSAFNGPINLNRGDINFINLSGSFVHFFEAESTHFEGDVLISSGFEAIDKLVLTDAKIEGNLDCSGGEFSSWSYPAIVAENIEVKGRVDFSNSTVKGGTDLSQAHIGKQLDCSSAKFFRAERPGDTIALEADTANIGGSVYLRFGFSAWGDVVFFATSIGGSFQWFHVASPEQANLDLRFAKSARLLNASDSLPSPGHLLIDGFVYEHFDERAVATEETQRRWLALQPHDRFRPQPFEQFADVLRKTGLEERMHAP